jgi:16S rRNA (cytosine967-C5)-methyltransferase
MSTNERVASNQKHWQRYLHYASSIISDYKGDEPFHLYLKNYFRIQKKHGSRDRRVIASLCYDYFRLGISVKAGTDINEKLLLGFFLVENKSSELFASVKQEWNDRIQLSFPEKIDMLNGAVDINNIFPFAKELSPEIDAEKFNLSFLLQPKVFIRIRPGNEKVVFKKLSAANIPYEKMNESCLAFSNTEKISEVLNIEKEVVIQDFNSQQTGTFLNHIPQSDQSINVWDCCAASGGKSIQAFDLLKNIELTVTDIRKSILENLKQRFIKAGISDFHSFVADISDDRVSNTIDISPDLIIADVPCSGSGTWARTPEQLHFFSQETIEKYAVLQKNIVKNSSEKLNAGGYFLFITCSVFTKENEENVDFLTSFCNLQKIESRYFKGYTMQADTLFAALFKKQ